MNLKKQGGYLIVLIIGVALSLVAAIAYNNTAQIELFYLLSLTTFMHIFVVCLYFIPLGIVLVSKFKNTKIAFLAVCIVGIYYIMKIQLPIVIVALTIVSLEALLSKLIKNMWIKNVIESLVTAVVGNCVYIYCQDNAFKNTKAFIISAFIILFVANTLFELLANMLLKKNAENETVKNYSKHSVNLKIMILINIACAVIIVLFGYFTYKTLKTQLNISEVEENILIQSAVAESMMDFSQDIYDENEKVLKEYEEVLKKRLTAVPLDAPANLCVALYKNDKLYNIGYYYIDKYDFSTKQYEVEWIDDVKELNNVYLYVAVPGTDNLYIEMLQSTVLSEQLVNIIRKVITALLIIIVVVNLIAQELVYRTLVRPINNLTGVAMDFAYSNHEDINKSKQAMVELDIKSGDEIDSLYQALYKTMTSMMDYINDIKEASAKVTQMQHNVITTMADIIESRDENTGGHVKRTAVYVKMIAEKLVENGDYKDTLTEKYIENMVVAAPLHDMGKIHVPDSILNKNGRLDDEEFGIMQLHAKIGKELLEHASDQLGTFEYLDVALKMAGSHHEWWNGKGYPEKLVGEKIPLCARIMAVADVFDALVSKRCYKEGMPLDKAYEIIEEEAGTHFDPLVAKAFVDCKDQVKDFLG